MNTYRIRFQCLLAFLVIPISIFSQDWLELSKDKSCTFYDIRDAFYQEYGGQRAQNPKEFKRFGRWAAFVGPRVYPSGKVFHPGRVHAEWEKMEAMAGITKKLAVASAAWTPVGPQSIPDQGGGMGRLNVVRIHPLDSNTIFVGASNGGLWKSTNAGQGWVALTDYLPNISVTDLIFHPQDPDIMFMATGDAYGLEISLGGLWGGTYSSGLLKTTDGGLTWSSTGLDYQMDWGRLIFGLAIHATNPDTILAGTDLGLYRTVDGGLSWSQMISGTVSDVEFLPSDPNTAIAVGDSFHRTTDGGMTWTVGANGMAPFFPEAAVVVAVTPAAPLDVHVFSQSRGFFHSVDGGISFITKYAPDGSQGWYLTGIEVSPTDPGKIVGGAVDMRMTTDAGVTPWTNISDWTGWPNANFAHADHRAFAFSPSGNTIYSGNDGGIFKTTDNGTSWTDLSEGLQITQIYRFGGSELEPGKIIVGTQDNGLNIVNNGNWDMTLLADGMDCMIHPLNSDTVYGSIQTGFLYKSSDGGATWTDSIVTPNSGEWTVPLAIDPMNPATIFFGGRQLHKSTDGGKSWSNLTNNQLPDYISDFALAPNQSNTIYVATGASFVTPNPIVEIRKTTDGGAVWTNISPGLPTSNAFINTISVKSDDANTLWAGFSGFTDGEKVYKSVDGGQNWFNISGTLPNIPMNDLLYLGGPLEELIVGSDLGVWYTNKDLNDWIPYGALLPNVIVLELEVNRTLGKVRAGTYGRGLWEVDLHNPSVGILENKKDEIVSVYPNPSSDFINLETESLYPWGYSLYDQRGILIRSNVDQQIGTNKVSIDVHELSPGNYFLHLETSEGWETTKVIMIRR